MDKERRNFSGFREADPQLAEIAKNGQYDLRHHVAGEDDPYWALSWQTDSIRRSHHLDSIFRPFEPFRERFFFDGYLSDAIPTTTFFVNAYMLKKKRGTEGQRFYDQIIKDIAQPDPAIEEDGVPTCLVPRTHIPQLAAERDAYEKQLLREIERLRDTFDKAEGVLRVLVNEARLTQDSSRQRGDFGRLWSELKKGTPPHDTLSILKVSTGGGVRATIPGLLSILKTALEPNDLPTILVEAQTRAFNSCVRIRDAVLDSASTVEIKFSICENLLYAAIHDKHVGRWDILQESIVPSPPSANWRKKVENIRKVLSDPELRHKLRGKTKSALYRMADELFAEEKSLAPANTYSTDFQRNMPEGEPKNIKDWCAHLGINPDESPIDT